MHDFNTTGTVKRELLLAFINVAKLTGDTPNRANPTWALLGTRVEDSSEAMEWGSETKQDIIGKTYGTMKKPVLTQTFDSWELTGADVAQKHIWELAVVDQNYTALCDQDILICHTYAGFAERYSSCMVQPTALGGKGGGTMAMPVEITYGGTRDKGTATISNGVPTFTPEAAPNYITATTTNGFALGVQYFTRTGTSASNYVYAPVAPGETAASGTTYYVISEE